MDSSTCSEVPTLLSTLTAQGTAVSRIGREMKRKDRVREMSKTKEGKSRLERKIAGHEKHCKSLINNGNY